MYRLGYYRVPYIAWGGVGLEWERWGGIRKAKNSYMSWWRYFHAQVKLQKNPGKILVTEDLSHAQRSRGCCSYAKMVCNYISSQNCQTSHQISYTCLCFSFVFLFWNVFLLENISAQWVCGERLQNVFPDQWPTTVSQATEASSSTGTPSCRYM